MENKSLYHPIFLFSIVILLHSCQTNKDLMRQNQDPILITNLSEGIDSNFPAIQKQFVKNNPGYAIDFLFQKQGIPKVNHQQIIFIQSGGGTLTMQDGSFSKFSVGDIILQRPADSFSSDSTFSALLIKTPDDVPDDLPTFIRPDWDENITDTPGGCATQTNAYRRILLTWKDSVGPYVFRSINAHRVRIMNSFTHYHPLKGGFDEFYLVQMAAPTAELITSHHVEIIENNDAIQGEQLPKLFQRNALQVGDLVYLPRGVIHRGIGNVLAQVITVPGFVPGGEIGVDHHLKNMNYRFGLNAKKALPYHKEASDKAVIK